MESFAIAVVAFIALCSGAQAQGYSTPAEQRYSPYSANLPTCDDPGVLARISGRFQQKETQCHRRSPRPDVLGRHRTHPRLKLVARSVFLPRVSPCDAIHC